MNYRPYPDVARALAQLERHQTADPLLAWIDEHLHLELTPWQRHVLDQPRRAGKSAAAAAIADQAVKAGEHVHVATVDGVRCAGADPACPLPRKAPEPPIVLARVDRTCTAVPSQWNAWTTDGQYLYMRYRSGIGTVDAFDSPTPETWPHFAAGLVARFEHGGRYAGDMSLTEFCERTGLQLADDAEVTGE